MRHHNNKRKFGRTKNQRNALMNSLALNLIVRGKIKTTEAFSLENSANSSNYFRIYNIKNNFQNCTTLY